MTVPEARLGGFDRALLAPFAVATIDQALMAVLHTRHAALRMLALSGRTVIIDEAHALRLHARSGVQADAVAGRGGKFGDRPVGDAA